MIITLNDNFRIHGIESCYQLERLRYRKGQPSWEAFKYYKSFRQALAQACQREIRTHPANTLTEAIEAATAIATKYGDLLDGALEEIAKREVPDIRLAS